MSTWKDRALRAEQKVAELELELQAYRDFDDDPEDLRIATIDQLAKRLGRLHHLSNGCRPAGMLLALLERPGHVLGRETLLMRSRGPKVWEDVGPRTVDVHVCRLRHALREIGFAKSLQTVVGVGWRIAKEDVAPIKERLQIV